MLHRKELSICYIGPFNQPQQTNTQSAASYKRMIAFIDLFKSLHWQTFIISPSLSAPSGKRIFRGEKFQIDSLVLLFKTGLLSFKIVNFLTSLMFTILQIIRLHSEKKISVIFIYNPTLQAGVPGIIAGKLFKIPIIIDYCDTTDSEVFHGFTRKFLSKIERIIVNNSDGLILVSSTFRDLINPELPHLLIRGFTKIEPDNSSFGRGKNDMVKILYSGRLDKIRGIDLFIASARLVKHTNCEFWVTGKGPLTEMVTDFANSYKNIKYWGFVSDNQLKSILNEVDIVINPQRMSYQFSKYCFPSKMFEYLNSGKVVISTEISDVEEAFKDLFFLTTKDTPEELAKIIDFAIDNLEEFLSKSKKNKQKMCQYSLQEKQKEIQEFFVEVLSAK
jgi:glycosyltransferase involved in cell wall biosynthesis